MEAHVVLAIFSTVLGIAIVWLILDLVEEKRD